MGSIFCRDCGEKLNMDAIDPNKLQKDVEKEKSIKLAKKRIKGAISAAVTILVVVAFVFVVFPDLFPFGNLRQYEEKTTVTEASANQKFNAAANGTSAGESKYSYDEINKMLKLKVVDPLAEYDSFAKVTGLEVTYDETKNHPVTYLWISIKGKVPVLYTIYGDFVFLGEDGNPAMPITLNVKHLDIGRLPVYASTNTFLKGFSSLLENEPMQNFFKRAQEVKFSADGMTVKFNKGNPSNSMAPEATTAPANVKSSAASEKAEAARQKAEEEKERKKQIEEERKRKAEEEAQRRKEKEEERKRKIEEEKERKKQQEEERKRKIEEENERRRQEAEDRKREREERRNNNYNSRSSRNNSRSSRNNRW